MKKIILLGMLFAASVCNAQVVLWDGEDKELGTRGGCWDDGSPTVVANPAKDAVNGSDKCLMFTMTNDSKIVKIPFSNWIKPNLAGNRRLSFMIKKSVNENVRVELSDPTDGSGGYWQKVAAWYGGDGKWQKVVLDFSHNAINDYPGVIAITGQTTSVSGSQYVYIDNIVVEPIPMVGETPLEEVENGTLEGAITVTGSYMKGTYMEANDEDHSKWKEYSYDDFATLKDKVAPGITSIDMRDAIVKNVYNSIDDYSIDDKNPDTPIYDKNPNALIFATESSKDDIANVVVNGTCATLNLNDRYAFSCPEDFTATTVNLTRSRIAGYNSFVLPFWVSATDLGASKVYTHKEGTTFKLDTDAYNLNGYAGANVPFLADYAAASSGVIEFSNKGVCHTPASFDGAFKGVYIPLRPGEVTGKWGINASGQLQKGGSLAYINPFHAYLELEDEPGLAREITIDDGEVTGIVNVKSLLPAEGCVAFDLQGRQVAQPTRGLYIVNGKKIVVK